MLREAARDVEALEPFSELPGSMEPIWFYYQDVGDRNKALNLARRLLERTGNPAAAFGSVFDLYCMGRFTEALQCFDQQRQIDPLVNMLRIVVLAELPNGRQLALEEFEKQIRQFSPEGGLLAGYTSLLLLLGRKDLAIATIQKQSTPPSYYSQAKKESFEAFRKFVCDELSEEKYSAVAGVSRIKQAEVHRDIGLSRLVTGDRAGAREHFLKSVGTHPVFGNRMLHEPDVSQPAGEGPHLAAVDSSEAMM
jgi:tetratricopeptide (TPR) repeat protein